MSERLSDASDEVLGRRLAAELPRHAAPPRLRAAILEAAAPRPRRAAWLPPVLSALATAMVLGLAFVPTLPRSVPTDPTGELLRSVLAEYTRAALWGARRAEALPAGLPWLAHESGIGLARVFAGDERLVLVGAEPVYLEGRRGIALSYRDGAGRLVIYMVLPAPAFRVPERPRVQIDRWKPALVQESGFSALVWKQGNLAAFLVADLVTPPDLERFKDYFARVRGATEPVPAN